MILLLLACVSDFQESEAGSLALEVGVPVDAAFVDRASTVHTETLDGRDTRAPTVGQAFALRVETAGAYRIELRSYFFDAYLVLRGPEGAVLAEDDNGLVELHSRITYELEADVDYEVQSCALHGRRGEYRLEVVPGLAPELPAPEAARASRLEAEARLGTIEGAFGEDDERTAEALRSLAQTILGQGDPTDAIPLLERAAAINESALGPLHATTAESFNELGTAHLAQGNYAEARRLIGHALTLKEELFGGDHPALAIVLSNLARVARWQGDLPTARSLYERALAVSDEPRSPIHAALLNNYAGLLRAQGDYTRARELYERALSIVEDASGPGHPDTAAALNNLALVLWDLGNYDTALELAERVVRIREQVLGPAHTDTGTSLNNLALILQAKNDFERARSIFERALAAKEEALGPDHPETARALNNLAVLLDDMGEQEAVLQLHERALAVKERVLGLRHPSTEASLSNLAKLSIDQGLFEKAWELYQRGHRLRETDRAEQVAALTDAERYDYVARYWDQLELQLSLALLWGEPEALVGAYEMSLAWKGRLARLLFAQRPLLSAEETDRELLSELRNCQAELAALALAGDVGEPADRVEQLRALRERRSSLEAELRRTGGAEASEIDDVSFVQLSSSLPASSVVLDFLVHRVWSSKRAIQPGYARVGYWSEPQLSVWITRPGSSQPIAVELGPSGPVEDAVRAFLADIAGNGSTPERSPDSTEEVTSPAGDLRRLLWEPIAPHVERNALVFVSPESFLATLPFEAIALEDGSRLIEHHPFVYLHDVSSLATRAERESGELDSLLAVGGVDFGGRSDGSGPADAASESAAPTPAAAVRGRGSTAWQRLPSTVGESRAVFELHQSAFGSEGRRLLLQGADATEERLRKELPTFEVLHLATHGFFDPNALAAHPKTAPAQTPESLEHEIERLIGDHPGLLSGLVLAGASRPQADRDDGYLTAEEVGWLELSKVEVVVLSACETGLGRAHSGEGLIGLRRAFHTAGAKTVVSSLWSVEDESTAALMQDFYRNLFERKMGRAESLRAAQLSMLRRNRAERAPPSWAAFVLSGEWR